MPLGIGRNYTLTADNGTTYQLTGNTEELKDHVGHEVQLTGKAYSSKCGKFFDERCPAGNSRGEEHETHSEDV